MLCLCEGTTNLNIRRVGCILYGRYFGGMVLSAISFGVHARQTQEAQIYSHGGPIRHRKHGDILTMDQADTGSAGIFSRQTNQTQEAQ
eukprot:6171107-Pyramimonas_sp.AAC.1